MVSKDTSVKNVLANLPKSHKKSKSPRIKALAYILYLEGLGFRGIARILKVSNVSVLKWIRDLVEVYGKQEKEKTPRYFRVIGMDEIWNYLVKKQKIWIWIAIDRDTREILGW